MHSTKTTLQLARNFQPLQSEINDWICFPNSRALCPLFAQIAQMGFQFAQMGSYFAQNTTPNPGSLLSHRTPYSGIYTYTRQPQIHPKTPLFLAWTLKRVKWTTIWAIWTPTGQNVWKEVKTFLEVGQKKISSEIRCRTPLPNQTRVTWDVKNLTSLLRPP